MKNLKKKKGGGGGGGEGIFNWIRVRGMIGGGMGVPSEPPICLPLMKT